MLHKKKHATFAYSLQFVFDKMPYHFTTAWMTAWAINHKSLCTSILTRQTDNSKYETRCWGHWYVCLCCWSLSPLLTSKLLGFNFVIHFHLQCPARPKLFLVIRFDFLFYYYKITHWPLTMKTFSAIPTQMMNISVKFHWNNSTKHRDWNRC